MLNGLSCIAAEAVPVKDYSQLRRIVSQECGMSANERVPFQMHGPFISGRYALVGCTFEEGGGQGIYKKNESGKWVRITSGGGALGMKGLLEYGVPNKNAEELIKIQTEYWKKNLKK